MDLGLKDAAVCVQGGSRGMGFAAAKVFAKEGARIAILGRTSGDLDAAVERLVELGSPDAVGIVADICDRASVDAAFTEISSRWGALNALVNAAGPNVARKAWHELDDEEWIDTINLGALGAVRCARAALPLLKAAKWGRIVNFSAMSTQHHSPGLADYTAAKSALLSISQNMSLELAGDGILVNVVSPGPFMSDGLRQFFLENKEAGVDPDDLVAAGKFLEKQFGSSTMLGRVGHPDEIGSMIAFAASPLSSFMTGANINVDGGSHFH